MPNAESKPRQEEATGGSISSHASRVTRHALPILRVSALTGSGLAELRAALARLVGSGRVDASPADLLWNARHRQALRRAREALDRARAAARDDLGAEYVAADLRDAHDALGAITGQVVAEDILDLIFAQFCIGK
jgi:tRNA modification GTPase